MPNDQMTSLDKASGYSFDVPVRSQRATLVMSAIIETYPESRFISEHDVTPLDYLEHRLGNETIGTIWMPAGGSIDICAEGM